MVGSLGKLYDSVQNLNQTYMQPNLNKDVLLKPKQRQPLGRSDQVLPLLIDGGSNANKLYTCLSCRRSSYPYRSEVCYVADDPKAIFPQCRGFMSKPMTYVAPPSVSAGETSAAARDVGL
ncbi:uncharacterized protein Pyn_35155 [Prunus yedoensis var. nudiflora]|uniref:Uncharacterized protein n=1 Tax=Prunus yedoensis var. nudiflora TaxID=2094558 RepID=A0A314YI34_PRUYE|nr:uncharacterized protein Pyn_35155 [Prunus yedoensis var. nudiflora]